MTAQTVSLSFSAIFALSLKQSVSVLMKEQKRQSAHLCQFCRKTRSYKTICDGITPAVMPQMCTVVLQGLGLFRVTTLQKMINSPTICRTLCGTRHVKCYSYHAHTSVTVSGGGWNATVHDPKP